MFISRAISQSTFFASADEERRIFTVLSLMLLGVPGTKCEGRHALCEKPAKGVPMSIHLLGLACDVAQCHTKKKGFEKAEEFARPSKYSERIL